MNGIVQTVCRLAFLAAMTGLCQTQAADPATVVYEENFNSYTDGEQPSSIFELHERPLDSGEAIGGRYAAARSASAVGSLTCPLPSLHILRPCGRPA